MKHIRSFTLFENASPFNSFEDWCRKLGYSKEDIADDDDGSLMNIYTRVSASYAKKKSSKNAHLINKEDINIYNVTEEYIAYYINNAGIQDDTTSITEEQLIKQSCEDLLGLQSVPGDTVTLYRLLAIDDEADIDYNNIGIHFVVNTYAFNDGGFLEEIGLGDDGQENAFILTCEVLKSDIDINATLEYNLHFSRETEITLKHNNKVKVISVESFN